MKILIIQAAGEHDGSTHLFKNDYLRECLSLQYAFQENGWEADVWGLRHKNFLSPPDFNSYDFILNLENYEMNWLPDLSKVHKPLKMQWIIDLHCQHSSRYARISAGMDIILHATESLMLPYKDRFFPNKEHIWFPPAIDDRYFKDYGMEKTKDLVFVGSILNRGDYVQKLHNQVGLQYFMQTGKEMLDLISSSKVHFNKTMSPHGTNYRNLETIGLGTCLLADDKPEVRKLGFVDGVNCLLYKNYDECLRKYNEAISSGRWKTIGEKGLELSKRHSYTARVKELIDNIGKLNNPKFGNASYNHSLAMQKKRHVFFIGDSHTTIHYESILHCNNTEVYRIHGSVDTPPLMYSFGKGKTSKINIEELSRTEIRLDSHAFKYGPSLAKYRPIQENDYVLFSMGEVDCRAHLGKHLDGDSDCESKIEEMVGDYMEAIQENKKLYNGNLSIIVAFIPPPVRLKDWPKTTNWPILSSDENRKMWVNIMNAKLKKYCEKYGYYFSDVYHKFVDDEGFLRKELSDGSNHINKSPANMEILRDHYNSLCFGR